MGYEQETVDRYLYNAEAAIPADYTIKIGDRGEQADVSPLEFHFEQNFTNTYGMNALKYLTREYGICDEKGKNYFLDYLVRTKDGKYAIEENGVKYSSRVLLEVVLVTAFVTGLANYILFPMTALCGASGVVFAFILLSSFTNFREGEIPVTFILVAVLFIGQQVWDGITVQDNISHMTHIIGGMIGYGLNCKSRFE